MSEYTERQKKAAAGALFIAQDGACLTAIARVLHEAGCAWLEATDSTDAANTCAPVKLMLRQMWWLAFGRCPEMPDYLKVRERCEEIVRSVPS